MKITKLGKPSSSAKLCIVVRMDGVIEDVAVLARDAAARAEAISLLDEIQLEISALERGIAERLSERKN